MRLAAVLRGWAGKERWEISGTYYKMGKIEIPMGYYAYNVFSLLWETERSAMQRVHRNI